QYSVGATKYCGGSSGSTNGLITTGGAVPDGYQSAKLLCQSAPGCGMSATAHMCSAEEMVRSAQLGISPSGPGWYSAGDSDAPQFNVPRECFGWTSNDSRVLGTVWDVTFPNPFPCSFAFPILCCD